METIQPIPLNLTIAKRPLASKPVSSKEVILYTNYFRVKFDHKILCCYEIKFSPEIPQDNFYKMNAIINDLERNKKLSMLSHCVCNGIQLISPVKLDSILSIKHTYKEIEYVLTVIKRSELNTKDIVDVTTDPVGAQTGLYAINQQVIQLMNQMKYFLIGKPGKHFKIADPKPVKNSSLMVFSGFKTSVKYLEGGLLLNVDYATRVVDRDNIYKFIVSKFPDFKTNKRSQQELKEFLTGKVVMAGYGKNRCYKLSDIDFESTPATEYIIINKPNEKGEEITKKVNLVEYYYSLYDKLKIEDPNKQPLLLIKKLIKGKERKGDNNSSVNGKLSLMTLGDKNYEIIKLVPSLCYISGISDDLRSDYSLMSSLAIHTKLEPAQRINKIRELVKELSNQCKQNLTTNGVNPKNIGFQIEGELAQKGKVIYPQTINLRSSEKGKENQLQADNGILKFRKGDKMKTEIDVGDWFLVYPKFEEELMDNLCQELKNAAFKFLA